ncbi:MAG: alternative ribosome rescue aminoacyl-tRNA hydrolase ArfB [Cellvibrionaceae bacterium]
MLTITDSINVSESEFSVTAVRSQGAGGQNVNKVATAIQLRFDINESSLPPWVKERLLRLNDKRVTKEGVLVIKSQETRSQERNYVNATERLVEFIRQGTQVRKNRLATRPSRGAKQRRMDSKKKRGNIKNNRKKITDYQ